MRIIRRFIYAYAYFMLIAHILFDFMRHFDIYAACRDYALCRAHYACGAAVAAKDAVPQKDKSAAPQRCDAAPLMRRPSRLCMTLMLTLIFSRDAAPLPPAAGTTAQRQRDD